MAILLISAGAKMFGKAIALYRIPQDTSALITASIDGPIPFILAITVTLCGMHEDRRENLMGFGELHERIGFEDCYPISSDYESANW